jgi:elongation factor P
VAYQPTDLKKGVVVQIDGKPFRVMEYNQKVMGRGGSIVNVKVKNLIDGSVIPKTFKGQERIDSAEVTNQSSSICIRTGQNFILWILKRSNSLNFQLILSKEVTGYLKEGENVNFTIL